MALDLRQTQKLSQQLVMSMQLQQAIKLLQLSHQELVATVEKELVENPALEEIPDSATGTVSDGERKLQDDAKAQSKDVVEQNNGNQDNEVDWQKILEQRKADGSVFQNAAGPSRFDDLPPIEQSLADTTDLTSHLIFQLGMQLCTDDERRAAACVILNLDHRGWLQATWEEVAEATGVDMDSVEGAVMIVRTLDPTGCGCRSLAETLAYQATIRWPEDPFIEELITVHLGNFEARNYQGIARQMELEVEDVVEYHKMIKELEPWPGRPYADLGNNYITPDIEVAKRAGEWVIVQNEDGLPRLRVSNYYQQVLSGKQSSREDKKYIKERLDSADFLIKSIFKRQRTIYRVMKCILDRQQGFFDRGVEHLRPMVLRDVADEIGVHESTVSRVTTNKYVQTPHGIFELKYFFSASIQRSNGDDLAAESVKIKIKRLVADENPRKPLSDSALVKLLKQDNITIARRTVAKYREQLGILSSSKRKLMF